MQSHLQETSKTVGAKVAKGVLAGKIKSKNFQRFWNTIDKEFFQHLVIVNNPYTKWFKKGGMSETQVKELIVQFSVFSNHFLVVQCKRMVNAKTEEGEKGARWILANEIGVNLDPKTGSCEGGKFATRAAHLNWLRDTAAPLNIDRKVLGNWNSGTEATHKFLKGLDETYGSPDENIGAGASFAIETWAGFGIGQGKTLENNNFWMELINGLKTFNESALKPAGRKTIPIGFFQYHFQIESGHVENVKHELEETFFGADFDEAKYLAGGKKALESIYTFWLGLDATRKKLA